MPQFLDKAFERIGAEVPLGAAADGDRAGAGLAIPEDEHERDLLELSFADLVPDLLVAEVGFRPKLRRAKSAGDLLGAVRDAVGDREDAHLDRRKPERERPRAVLDQDPHEPLERAEHCAMDHDGTRRLPVRGLIAEIEALGVVEVELDRPELVLAAERVEHEEVDLGPVEGAVSGMQLVADSQASARRQISSEPTDFSGLVESPIRTSSNPKTAYDSRIIRATRPTSSSIISGARKM